MERGRGQAHSPRPTNGNSVVLEEGGFEEVGSAGDNRHCIDRHVNLASCKTPGDIAHSQDQADVAGRTCRVYDRLDICRAGDGGISARP